MKMVINNMNETELMDPPILDLSFLSDLTSFLSFLGCLFVQRRMAYIRASVSWTMSTQTDSRADIENVYMQKEK